MSLALLHPALQAVTPSLSLHQQLEQAIRHVTAVSDHTYEIGVRRLLEDMAELHATGQIDTGSYHAVLGMSVDVLFFFNYDLAALLDEPNQWYRASLIHQMGHGMLQALEKFRPDLTQKPFFQEAVCALAIGTQKTSAAPVTCRQWKSSFDA